MTEKKKDAMRDEAAGWRLLAKAVFRYGRKVSEHAYLCWWLNGSRSDFQEIGLPVDVRGQMAMRVRTYFTACSWRELPFDHPGADRLDDDAEYLDRVLFCLLLAEICDDASTPPRALPSSRPESKT